MKLLLLTALQFIFLYTFGQGIHQIELNSHPEEASSIVPAKKKVVLEKNSCNLNKTVFGWHPYWMNGAEQNYQWNLLSDLCFFAYEVDATTGNAISTHGWATNDAVDSAIANGTNVHLCATLFSNHATFFGSSTAQNTLITNLISLIQTRGAQGVNIDFEGVPSSQSSNLTNFIINLGTQLHAANPNYKLSICLYAVDWSNVFNEPILNNYVDFYTIMGYDYYWTGSAQAGPNDPLYGFTSGYDYSLSRSISYYLNEGIPNSKLILGLPYYGREWETTSNSVPSSTTGNNVYSRTYSYIKNNSSGFYSTANSGYDLRSTSKNYIFQNTGTWRQCWVSEANELEARMETVQRRNLKGIGIWALGYDDGYSELWQAINSKLTDCRTWNCSDTLFDEGGPLGAYYNNENVQYTISPLNATALQVNFLEFTTEANFDTLFLYDGASTTSPLIGFYHGSNGPGQFTTSSGQLTLRFKSDGSTRANGWKLAYDCIVDNISPITASSFSSNWLINDDTCTFTDYDNLQVAQTFWNASSLDNSTWCGNVYAGQVQENFTTISNWINYSGVWQTTSGILVQNDESNSNTNLSLPFSDTCSQFILEYSAKINGAGSNRRAGIHYMCSDLSLTNRGNSYFIYLRVDSDVIQWYKVTNDVFTLVHSENYSIFADTMYNIKIWYSKFTGENKVFINDVLIGTWIDVAPLSVNNGFSLRSGNCNFDVDFVKLYKQRSTTTLTTVGNNKEFYTCNPNPSTKAGKIESLNVDVSNLIGKNIALYNVDYSFPINSQPTEENIDIDTLLNTTDLLLANLIAVDSNSSIANKEVFVIQTNTGDTILFPTTFSNGSLFTTLNGLVSDSLYHIGFISTNGAGLTSTTFSDGFRYYNTLGTNHLSQLNFNLYPNPAANKITLETNNTTLKNVSIYSLDGKLIESFKMTNSYVLNIEDYANGTYFIITNDVVIRFIKRN